MDTYTCVEIDWKCVHQNSGRASLWIVERWALLSFYACVSSFLILLQWVDSIHVQARVQGWCCVAKCHFWAVLTTAGTWWQSGAGTTGHASQSRGDTVWKAMILAFQGQRRTLFRAEQRVDGAVHSGVALIRGRPAEAVPSSCPRAPLSVCVLPMVGSSPAAGDGSRSATPLWCPLCLCVGSFIVCEGKGRGRWGGG